MDFGLLRRVNGLWRKIYPFLVSQIAELYEKDSGTVLELGPFSGGISMALAKQYPEFRITIADESPQVLDYFKAEINASGLSGDIEIRKTALTSLNFSDFQFDLVIFRGAFFFLDNGGEILKEIFRVLKEGGRAFIGGGYGKDTPSALIHEIADESRALNDKLGRNRISVEELEGIIRNAALDDSCRIVEEGGLWVIMKK
ncbi:MAG: class I SAM-dependent methyltransferase [Deltaproteobacteria bacterium]|nr:class I SAM-dependent methyltransferase [Deltaproteobacteria bacterium]